MNATTLFCALAGLALGASACLHPGTIRPELSRIPSYPDRAIQTPSEVDPVLLGYADQVGAPPDASQKTLDAKAVRRLVLENSPEVLLAQTRVEQAQARLETAGAWPNPEIDGRYLMDPDGHFFTETAFRFVLPLGGRIGKAEALAARELDLARLELLVARRQALSKVDRILARLAKARSQLGMLRSLADRSKRYAELSRTRQSSSMADPLDVALVLADARTDRRAVQRQQTRVRELERQMRLLAGLPPGECEFQADEQKLHRLRESPVGLERDVAGHNSTVLLSRLRVRVARQKAARAAAERVPDLQLGPALTSDADGVAMGISLGLPIPILQTGLGPVQEALAEQHTAEEEYRQALRSAIVGVQSAVARHRSLVKELDELRGEAARALEEAVQLAEVRYSAGKLDVLRLLSVHRAYSRLKLQQLDLLLKIAESLIDIRDAVGKHVVSEEVNP